MRPPSAPRSVPSRVGTAGTPRAPAPPPQLRPTAGSPPAPAPHKGLFVTGAGAGRAGRTQRPLARPRAPVPPLPTPRPCRKAPLTGETPGPPGRDGDAGLARHGDGTGTARGRHGDAGRWHGQGMGVSSADTAQGQGTRHGDGGTVQGQRTWGTATAEGQGNGGQGMGTQGTAKGQGRQCWHGTGIGTRRTAQMGTQGAGTRQGHGGCWHG